MDRQIEERKRACDAARNAEWDSVIVAAGPLDPAQRSFLEQHPPGLVAALWQHFDRTRERCGCETSAHEKPDCTVLLIERLLRDEEAL